MTQDDYAFIFSLASLVLSGVAIMIAWRQARQANQLTQQVARGETISHFTDRFFDLLKDVKHPSLQQQLLNESGWAHQFWSLHATEFYFFHHGILPRFMYALWMVYLAELYSGPDGARIWDAHKTYLDTYSLDYNDMYEFYAEIYRIASVTDSPQKQNREVAAWVERWIRKNRRQSFQ